MEQEINNQNNTNQDPEINETKSTDVSNEINNVVDNHEKEKSTIAKAVEDKLKDSAKSAVMGKLYMSIFILVLVVAVVVFVLINPFGWKFSFKNGGYAKIDKTENVVDQVKKISEFTTACFYQEMVIQRERYDKKRPSLFASKDEVPDSVRHEVVLIVKGKVRAGFDLGKIAESDLQIHSDSLYIAVPHAEIFDVIINPSDYEVYEENGKWTHDEISAIQQETEAKLQQRALDENILDKANEFGLTKLNSLFKSFGFSYVNVKLKEN